MKEKRYLIIFVITLLVSCKTDKKNNIPVINLQHIDIPIKKNIKDPHALIYLGEKRFVILNGQTECFFDLCDLNHNTYLSFGLKGKGPGELISVVSPIYNKKLEQLQVYDLMKGEYYSIHLNNVNNKEQKFSKIFDVDRDDGWPLRFIPFYDSSFIAIGTFRKNRFGLFSSNGHLEYTFGNYPSNELNGKLNFIQLSEAYDGPICVHPNKPMFVTVIPGSDLLEIYIKKKQDFVLVNPDYKPEYPPCFKVFRMGKQGSVVKCKNNIIGFWGCAVSDKYIFSLFGKEKLNDLLQGKTSYPKRMWVFDWHGEKKAILHFDYPIGLYTVVRKKNIHFIYAIAFNDPSNLKLVKYEIRIK